MGQALQRLRGRAADGHVVFHDDDDPLAAQAKKPKKDEKKDEEPKISFGDGVKTIRSILPYFWPADWSMRMRLIVTLTVLVLAKVVNMYVPQMYKRSINALTLKPSSTQALKVPVNILFGYASLRLLSSASSDLMRTTFLPVSNAATRSIALGTFRHLHNLSLRFHLTRKTGAVLRTIDRGTTSANTLMSLLLFNIAPTILELGMVCIVLLSTAGYLFSLITFTTIVLYVIVTLGITQWRKKFRRQMNERENQTSEVAVDSLLNYETVKYFTAEEHELNRYDHALSSYFDISVHSRMSLAVLNISQSLIINAGLFFCLLLSAHEIVKGRMNVGDMVAIQAYLLQLYSPLSWLGSSYRLIIQSVINMEQMLQIIEEPNEVPDSPDATDLDLAGGEIEFHDVCFSYNEDRQILDKVSFKVPPGKMVALVGSSGGGKSTVFRLLCRFYDPTSGYISVDGQNVRFLTQQSLRRSIGVVPQDTVLFNDTIGYNIAYGALGDGEMPSQQEIERASYEAHIDEFISRCPEGYDTPVGERGLRLSGGEKQRVAIARVLLKDPRILILDEATSALDTKTEREIQASLNSVAKGRTTLVIAHRLSTIKNADEILVLNHGRIVERGAHDDLIASNGVYADMWEQQQEVPMDDEGSDDVLTMKGKGDAVLIDLQ